MVLSVLRNAGGRPLLAGGCVRDALLGVASKDVDIEVYGAGIDDLQAELEEAGLRVDAVGRSFGVLKTKVGDEEFDIALPRRDSKVGSGHRGFDVIADHTLDPVDASGRRDFTINSMMWDPHTGDLIDAHGGLNDLDQLLLRHTTDAFADDPLRALRGVQFAGRFGMTFDPATAQLCNDLADTYTELPVERVWGEWAKIATKAERPGMSLSALKAIGWDRHYPQLTAIDGVAQDPGWHPEGTVEVHTAQAADSAATIAAHAGLSADDRQVLTFGAIAHDFGKATHTQVHSDGRVTSRGHAEAGVEPTLKFLRSIGCPERLAEQVVPLVREHMCAATTHGPTPSAVRRLSRRLGPTSIEMWAMVVQADNMGRGTASKPGPAGDWVRIADQIGVRNAPRPPILTGQHLIDAGLRPGPDFKPLLDGALAAQDDGVIHDGPSAQAWLRTRLAGTGQR